MTKRILTQQELKSEFFYSTETGLFTRLRKLARGSNAKIGVIVGSVLKSGYVSISIRRVKYPAHRLAWLYMYGKLPILDIDHINGIKTDNRICNLREATVYQNTQNLIRANKSNKTGYLGVYKKDNKYCSEIQINKKSIYLGKFETPEEAHEVYLNAKRKLHEFCTI